MKNDVTEEKNTVGKWTLFSEQLSHTRLECFASKSAIFSLYLFSYYPAENVNFINFVG